MTRRAIIAEFLCIILAAAIVVALLGISPSIDHFLISRIF